MFEGFQTFDIELPDARLFGRLGGSGPPLLLLHGHPRTHATWGRVAPLLADQFTVVCPDLRGFGRSSQPVDTPGHLNSSKREKGRDCVALMNALGFSSFGLVGHDRGAYTAFRCAMDHPRIVRGLVFLGAVPILDAFEQARAPFALAWWHWFFFCTPEKPERAISADPIGWYAPDRSLMGEENYADFCAAVSDPAIVHGMLEDYRAGPGIDCQHDAADRVTGRQVECPVLVLWALNDDDKFFYDDLPAIWNVWGRDVRSKGFPSGHHMAEEQPDLLAEELKRFFAPIENGAVASVASKRRCRASA